MRDDQTLQFEEEKTWHENEETVRLAKETAYESQKEFLGIQTHEELLIIS